MNSTLRTNAKNLLVFQAEKSRNYRKILQSRHNCWTTLTKHCEMCIDRGRAWRETSSSTWSASEIQCWRHLWKFTLAANQQVLLFLYSSYCVALSSVEERWGEIRHLLTCQSFIQTIKLISSFDTSLEKALFIEW